MTFSVKFISIVILSVFLQTIECQTFTEGTSTQSSAESAVNSVTPDASVSSGLTQLGVSLANNTQALEPLVVEAGGTTVLPFSTVSGLSEGTTGQPSGATSLLAVSKSKKFKSKLTIPINIEIKTHSQSTPETTSGQPAQAPPYPWQRKFNQDQNSKFPLKSKPFGESDQSLDNEGIGINSDIPERTSHKYHKKPSLPFKQMQKYEENPWNSGKSALDGRFQSAYNVKPKLTSNNMPLLIKTTTVDPEECENHTTTTTTTIAPLRLYNSPDLSVPKESLDIRDTQPPPLEPEPEFEPKWETQPTVRPKPSLLDDSLEPLDLSEEPPQLKSSEPQIPDIITSDEFLDIKETTPQPLTALNNTSNELDEKAYDDLIHDRLYSVEHLKNPDLKPDLKPDIKPDIKPDNEVVCGADKVTITPCSLIHRLKELSKDANYLKAVQHFEHQIQNMTFLCLEDHKKTVSHDLQSEHQNQDIVVVDEHEHTVAQPVVVQHQPVMVQHHVIPSTTLNVVPNNFIDNSFVNNRDSFVKTPAFRSNTYNVINPMPITPVYNVVPQYRQYSYRVPQNIGFQNTNYMTRSVQQYRPIGPTIQQQWSTVPQTYQTYIPDNRYALHYSSQGFVPQQQGWTQSRQYIVPLPPTTYRTQYRPQVSNANNNNYNRIPVLKTNPNLSIRPNPYPQRTFPNQNQQIIGRPPPPPQSPLQLPPQLPQQLPPRFAPQLPPPRPLPPRPMRPMNQMPPMSQLNASPKIGIPQNLGVPPNVNSMHKNNQFIVNQNQALYKSPVAGLGPPLNPNPSMQNSPGQITFAAQKSYSFVTPNSSPIQAMNNIPIKPNQIQSSGPMIVNNVNPIGNSVPNSNVMIQRPSPNISPFGNRVGAPNFQSNSMMNQNLNPNPVMKSYQSGFNPIMSSNQNIPQTIPQPIPGPVPNSIGTTSKNVGQTSNNNMVGMPRSRNRMNNFNFGGQLQSNNNIKSPSNLNTVNPSYNYNSNSNPVKPNLDEYI